MTSLPFILCRSILRIKYSKSNDNPTINLKKARRFECALPSNYIKKSFVIDIITVNDRDIYILSPLKDYSANKLLLYFHGGAYITGITVPHWHFVKKIVNQTGAKLILPDYPVAPEYNYKQTIGFSLKLYQEFLKEYGPSNIYFIGDSCGGGLSLSLSQAIKENNLPQPKKIILLSPWLDLSVSNPDIIELQKKEIMLLPKKLKKAGDLYRGDLDPQDPLISPLYADTKVFPEIHLFIGTHDILLADARKFRENARNEGKEIRYYEYDKMIHCWMLFPVPEAKVVLNKMKQILLD